MHGLKQKYWAVVLWRCGVKTTLCWVAGMKGISHTVSGKYTGDHRRRTQWQTGGTKITGGLMATEWQSGRTQFIGLWWLQSDNLGELNSLVFDGYRVTNWGLSNSSEICDGYRVTNRGLSIHQRSVTATEWQTGGCQFIRGLWRLQSDKLGALNWLEVCDWYRVTNWRLSNSSEVCDGYRMTNWGLSVHRKSVTATEWQTGVSQIHRRSAMATEWQTGDS